MVLVKKMGRNVLHRVKDLEAAVKTPQAPSTLVALADRAMQCEVVTLRATKKMLVGVTSKLQHNNKTLQNQLYIQQDRSNYLNLHLGGCEELEDKTCKEEAVAFFKNILQLKDISVKDFVKAHRKSSGNQYTEEVKDGANVVKLKATAPGIMFVHMASENLREMAIQRACGLSSC